MSEEFYSAQLKVEADKKKIIVCCDGTGNEFGDTNSNVVRIYTALKIDNAQVGYYHPGVGTMGNPAVQGAVFRWFSKVGGLAFGTGFKDNVLDAYRYLMDTYDDGDAVYIFGFSRGAYTARALAGLLDGYGLLCKGNEGHIPYTWRLYLDQLKNRDRHSLDLGRSDAAAFKETFSRKNFGIHFIGLWDTVSSVGWVSTPLRLFNIAENPTLQHIRHAVSIDERRCFYRDNLYGQPLAHQTMQQVWFPGVHSDVGGSYPQTESGLSNEALRWMIYEAEHAGVVFAPERKQMLFGTPDGGYPQTSKLYAPGAATEVHRSLKGLWWLLEVLPHRYYDKDDNVEQKRVPLGVWRKIPAESLVHGSAYERLNDVGADYRPQNLHIDDLHELPKAAPLQPFKLYRYKPRRNDEENDFLRIVGLAISWMILIILGLIVTYWFCRFLCHLPSWLHRFGSYLCNLLERAPEAWRHFKGLPPRP
jgi:uncharacterized protein (DUF2235 family)